MKRITLVITAVGVVIATCPVYLTGVALGLWQPLSRPIGVSARARYVETLRSAGWFDCSVDRIKDADVCKVWDRDGRLVAFGHYRLDGENRAARAAELRFWYVEHYTGHPDLAWIYLSDHGTLVPVNDTGQPLQRFEVRLGDSSR